MVDGTELSDDTRKIDEVRREVGMVFQHFHLFPHLTVLENCMLAPVRVRRLPKRDAQATRHALPRVVRIAELAARYPGQLSGGQQQRVWRSRGLSCMNPRVMLFDEPTSALDPKWSRKSSTR